MSAYLCRECGITHIDVGMEIDGQPLCWVDDDLCSACSDRLEKQLNLDAARYRHLRNRQTRACDIATGGVFAGCVPENIILGGEDLDRAIDAELGLALPQVEPLETRLAKCLAECIDTPILTGRDNDHSTPLELRLAFFKPDLVERAAELLEEAGE